MFRAEQSSNQSSDRKICEALMKRKCLEIGAFGLNCSCLVSGGVKIKENIFQRVSYCFGVRRSRNFSCTSRTTSVALVSGSLIFTYEEEKVSLFNISHRADQY